MSYADIHGEGEGIGPKLKRVGVFIAVLLIIFVMMPAVLDGYRSFKIGSQMDFEMHGNVIHAPLYDTFRDEFPAEYAEFRSRLAVMAREGASNEQLSQFGFGYMRNFTLTKGEHLVAAPDDALIELMKRNLALVRALRDESLPLCAQMTATGLQPGNTYSPPVQRRIISVSVQTLKSIAAGQQDPHPRGEVTQEDVDSLYEALVGTIPEQDALAVINGMGFEALPLTNQCAAGLALYEAVGKLPEDASMRLTAAIIAPQPNAR